MKKIYNVLFVLFLVIIFSIDANAETYKCHMAELKPTVRNDVLFTVDTDEHSIDTKSIIVDARINDLTDADIYERFFNNGNGCPSNAYVYYLDFYFEGAYQSYVIFDVSLLREPYKVNVFATISISNVLPIKWGKSSDKESFLPKISCTSYNELYEIMEENYCVIETDKDCNSKKKGKYNEAKMQLKNLCSQIVQYTNYDISNSCMEPCLKLNETIELLENKNSNSHACGFSDNLLGFIGNIMKWVKYLIPAIIIILSILDFIKAIGSDKEDEMKKAQHKLVIRLIVAVLIFIIPFIIEFILDKMGFFAEGCGIIDF